MHEEGVVSVVKRVDETSSTPERVFIVYQDKEGDLRQRFVGTLDFRGGLACCHYPGYSDRTDGEEYPHGLGGGAESGHFQFSENGFLPGFLKILRAADKHLRGKIPR